MPQGICFDNKKYLADQTAAIRERVSRFNHKLYLEFGGKLLFDLHASRVLPGFDPNVKMRLLQALAGKVEVILCIYAGDIEKKKVRADFGITYDADAMKLMDDLAERGVPVTAVVITRYQEQPAAASFKAQLENRGIRVFTHAFTKGYPTNVDLVVSDEGYGANPYIETESPIVVVTGPGPGSGKLATCLSQLYHDHRRGLNSGYAKFETFPIWNLPLKHPVNAAYEAATAELKDVNRLDHFHLEAYGEQAVNYNRDLEAFPLLKRIIERITGGESFYRSPTDMGVNRAGVGIVDDEVAREAGRQEIVRRFFRYSCEQIMGLVDREAVERIELLMEEMGVRPENRPVVEPARRAAQEARQRNRGSNGAFVGAALELPSGEIVTGYNSPLLHASAALVIRAAKRLAGVPPGIDLLPESSIHSISHLKKEVLERKRLSLDTEEALIVLAINATSMPEARRAVDQLKALRRCEVHMTHMPTPGDEAGLRRLGVNLTADPRYVSHRLFMR